MSLFHKVRLTQIDPLGDGLGDMIKAEQREPEAIDLHFQPDSSTLKEEWERVVSELKTDPSWFDFADD